MKVVKVGAFGPPETLEFGEGPDPQASRSGVIVKVEAIGLGYMDTMARRGGSYLGSEPGFIPGYEVAGRVIAAGPGARDWMGRRVFALLRQGGGCAELVSVEESEIVRIPDGLSFDDAVGTGLNALVASGALSRLPVAEGDRVLVRGAGGGIGLMCVQFTALRGGKIVATSSSRERGDRLLALGASTILNRLEPHDRPTGTFDVIIDTIIGEELPRFFDLLAANGHYLMCGGIGGLPPADFGMKLIEHFHGSPTVHAFSLNSLQPHAIRRLAVDLFERVKDKQITPVIDTVLPLGEIVAAHTKLEEGRAFGKIILRPE